MNHPVNKASLMDVDGALKVKCSKCGAGIWIELPAEAQSMSEILATFCKNHLLHSEKKR